MHRSHRSQARRRTAPLPSSMKNGMVCADRLHESKYRCSCGSSCCCCSYCCCCFRSSIIYRGPSIIRHHPSQSQFKPPSAPSVVGPLRAPVSGHRASAADHRSSSTRHSHPSRSYVTGHTSPVTRHRSPVTVQRSNHSGKHGRRTTTAVMSSR